MNNKIQAFFDKKQLKHRTTKEIRYGKWGKSYEGPKRAKLLLQALKDADIPLDLTARDYGLAPIRAVHTQRYINFLETIYDRWKVTSNAARDVISGIYPAKNINVYPQSLPGQVGFHIWDTGAPITPHTFSAACASANSAISAADYVFETSNLAYGLCRPPGHHAFAESAGGYCYLANIAIAAEYLLSKGAKKIAVVDIDLHHGNGTQDIFYNRSDVLTVSIHAHPELFFPFFWGYEEEKGAGKGEGYNHNLCLPNNIQDDAYLEALDHVLKKVIDHSPDFIIIGLGLDIYEKDPYHGFCVSTNGFARIAQRFSKLEIPTVLIQEGGYVSDELGENLIAFINGFLNG